MAAGMITTLAAPEPLAVAVPQAPPSLLARLEAAFLAPLRDFLSRNGAVEVLAFVLLFRVGKVFADGTAAGFYRYQLGYAPSTVAAANFLPGLIGVLAGAAFGGRLVARLGASRALLLAGLAQAASLGLYLVLMSQPPSLALLSAKVGLEFFAGAAADIAFLSYISALCSTAYTATQYALLSSLAALAFHTLGGLSGFAAEALGYRDFFLATMLAGIPALLVMLHMLRRFPAAQHNATWLSRQ